MIKDFIKRYHAGMYDKNVEVIAEAIVATMLLVMSATAVYLVVNK